MRHFFNYGNKFLFTGIYEVMIPYPYMSHKYSKVMFRIILILNINNDC